MKCVALWSGKWTVNLLIKIWSSGLDWSLGDGDCQCSHQIIYLEVNIELFFSVN